MRPDLVATDNPRNPREYLERFFFDSWVADPRALQYLLDTCGAERVMLGTDYPFPLGEQTPGAGIDAMDMDEAGKARPFHGTADRKSVVWGTRWSVRVDFGGRGILTKKKNRN